VNVLNAGRHKAGSLTANLLGTSKTRSLTVAVLAAAAKARSLTVNVLAVAVETRFIEGPGRAAGQKPVR
jgi:hypothetical protein